MRAAEIVKGIVHLSHCLPIALWRFIGLVVVGSLKAGASNVFGVSFSVSDESAWQSQARAAAMADARSRALELAGLAGVELGGVLSVSEVIGGVSVPVMAVAERGMGGGGIAPSELELGTQI
jgi:uncharacterized protein YggE